MNECLFCQIIEGKIPGEIIYEDDLVVGIMDIDPINDGHVLLMTKAHKLDLDDLSDEEACHLWKVSRALVKTLKALYGPQGYTLMQNGGAFNDIGHFHLHIFPRYDGDGFAWQWGDLASKNLHDEGEKIKKALEDKLS